MEDYESDFLNYMRDKRKASTNTLNAYKIDISKFSEYIKDNCGLSLADVNKTTILNYLMDLQSNGRSPATISRTLASIRSFYKYLTNYGYITNDPAYELRSFKSIRKSPQGLSRFQIEILLSESEFSAMRENAQRLSDMGFKADFSAGPFIKLSAVISPHFSQG